jgi:hypothetical protein
VVALPWYLLAAGIALVVLGALLSGLGRPEGSGRRRLDPAMRDDEIIRELGRKQRVTLPNLMVLAGIVCVLVSVVWRLARLVLARLS